MHVNVSVNIVSIQKIQLHLWNFLRDQIIETKL